jgi:hypothetical protein
MLTVDAAGPGARRPGHPCHPSRSAAPVEYSLTRLGKTLRELVRGLVNVVGGTPQGSGSSESRV